MRLIYRIALRTSAALTIVLALWAVLFYLSVASEIDEEADEVLDDYAEVLVMQVLTGDDLSDEGASGIASYRIEEMSEQEASMFDEPEYSDRRVYFPAQDERAPARVLNRLFCDAEGDYHLLTVAMPNFGKEELKDSVFIGMAVLYGILLLTIIGVTIWVFYRSIRPLYVLLDWLEDYRVGQENRPLENRTDVREFQKLNEAVDRYRNRIERLFDQQKQFIGNASHELQTPLAVCRNRLEWLVDHTELSEEQLREVMRTRQAIDRIVRLNRSLLFLSKIDNGQFPEADDVELGELVERMLADYGELYESRDLQIGFVRHGTFTVRMNRSLAEALLSNLLRNAFIHSPAGGQVKVVVAHDEMVFCNTAEKGALDEGSIFERFWRGENKEGSSGLGLAIVRSICAQYGLWVAYLFEGGLHCFHVRRNVRN